MQRACEGTHDDDDNDMTMTTKATAPRRLWPLGPGVVACTLHDVDVGAGPEEVAASPLHGLTDHAERAAVARLVRQRQLVVQRPDSGRKTTAQDSG